MILRAQCGIIRKFLFLLFFFSQYSSSLYNGKSIYFSIFANRFRITYRLILREKELHFHIGVYNPSKDLTFSFNLLLHTYLKVPDVRRCQITGLHGCTFIDKTRDGLIYQEGRDVVTINEFCGELNFLQFSFFFFGFNWSLMKNTKYFQTEFISIRHKST